MEVDFDDKKVKNGDILANGSKFDLLISWDHDKKKHYTLAIIDLDAPYPGEAESDYIHLLTINIPGDDLEKGKEIVNYQAPAPPKDSPPHEYKILIYQQPAKFNLEKVKRQTNLEDILPEDLLLVGELSFEVANTDQEQRFCTCILHVEARNHPSCVKGRRGRGKCYNPYAVCAAGVGTTSRNCTKFYKLEDLGEEELKAYARLYGVSYSDTDTNKIILEKIYKKKEQEGKS